MPWSGALGLSFHLRGIRAGGQRLSQHPATPAPGFMPLWDPLTVV